MSIQARVGTPSGQLILLLSAFVFGVLVGSFTSIASLHALLLTVAGICAAAILIRHPMWRLGLLIPAVFLFGVFRVGATEIPAHVPRVDDRVDAPVRVQGTVVGDAERRVNRQNITIASVRLADNPYEGHVLVFAPLYPRVRPGDSLQFSCRLSRPEPFNGFAYDRFLASRDTYALCYRPEFLNIQLPETDSLSRIVIGFRDRAVLQLHRIVPQPHAAFLSGLLFGGSTSLSRSIQDDFAATGTSHILAASGYNVSLFSFVFFSWIIQWTGRRKGIVLTVGLIGAYAIAAGFTPAVLRAVLMAGIVLFSFFVRRRTYLPTLVLSTAVLLLLFEPRMLLWDVGFQLSFVATIALMTLGRRWQARLTMIPNRLGLRESVAASLAAIVATLPIVIWHFGSVSLLAPLANLVVLPFVPYMMLGSILGLSVSIISLTAGLLVMLPTWAMSWMVLTIIQLYASLPFASISIPASRLVALAVAAGLCFLWYVHNHARTIKTDK